MFRESDASSQRSNIVQKPQRRKRKEVKHVEALHYHELQNTPENYASASGCSSAVDDPVREPEGQGRPMS